MSDPSVSDLLGALTSRLDFAPLLGDHGRLLQMETALPMLALIPERLVMKEAVDRPFELAVEALSTSAHFELKLLIGEQVSVRLLQADGRYKPWHGYVAGAAQLGSDGGLARYRLTVVSWLAFLQRRYDSFVHQDKTALEVIEDIFKDCLQAHYRIDVSAALRRREVCTQYRESDFAFVTRLLAEEGLSYHFEHLDGEAAQSADRRGHARHVLVIQDLQAARADLGPVRFTGRSVTAHLPGQKDAITAFSVSRSVGANAVALGAWDAAQLAGVAAADSSALDLGELPVLEVYDGSGAGLYENPAHAESAAAHRLAALELGYKHCQGQGSARHFEAGSRFSLVDHPLFGANTSAFDHPGALTASHRRTDNAFTLLAVEHHAANNLGAAAARLLRATDLEQGSYAQQFTCVPAAAPLVPRFIRKPTAPGAQSALVVGVEGAAITTDREHRVKVQFGWQRGERPNQGGLPHEAGSAGGTGATGNAGAGAGRPAGGGSTAPPASAPTPAPAPTSAAAAGGTASSAPDKGNAPGDERSGTWLRVSEPAAGANWGAVFTPRIGSEVSIAYLEGDIDRPIVSGGLYNGVDTPPFAAGVDSGVNHAGVISGVQTQGLDGAHPNQWVIDDASGQLRMRLHSGYGGAEIGLGHLIQQPANGAHRGAWRGSGFEATTRGWTTVRAGQGLLLSTATRAGSYGSAQSTQLDASEAVAQLKGAQALGRKLSDAAEQSQAQALATQAEGGPLQRLIAGIDATQDGRHAGDVNGQPATKADRGGAGGGQGRGSTASSDSVEAFATPLVVLDTPATAIFTSEAAITAYAGQDASTTAQGDTHHTAAHTWASVSGGTTSWYTHEGGIKAFAASGALSLRAHTDALQILADKDVTVVSVNDEIRISAKSRIELVAGQSSVVLDGANITFTCPGQWQVKASAHAFLEGGSDAALMEALPVGQAGLEPLELELNHHWPDLTPVAGAAYTVLLADGSKRSGKLDGNGHAKLTGLPPGPVEIVYGEDTTAFLPKRASKVSVTDEGLAADIRKLGFDPDDVDIQGLIEHESGRQL